LHKTKALVLNYPTTPRRDSNSGNFSRSGRVREAEQDRGHSYAAYAGAGLRRRRRSAFYATPGAKTSASSCIPPARLSHDRLALRVCGGHELLRQAYGDIKDNSDSGQFLAIQHAAATRWTIRKSRKRSPTNIAPDDALVEVLAKAGFSAKKPEGSFFSTSKRRTPW